MVSNSYNGLFRKIARVIAYTIALGLSDYIAEQYSAKYDTRATVICLFVLFGAVIELLSDRVQKSWRYGVYLMVVMGIVVSGLTLVGKAQDFKKCYNEGVNYHGSCHR